MDSCRRPLLALAVAVLLSVVAVLPGLADEDVGDGLAPDTLGGGGLAYPVLGSLLSGVAEDYLAASGASPGDPLMDSPATPHAPGDADNYAATMFGLSITVEGDVQRVVDLITANGGDVRNVVDGYIEAFVPASALPALAAVGGVTWAREMARPFRTTGRTTSSGVGAHFANDWHAQGITGRGVKVGVIDTTTTFTSKDGFYGLVGAQSDGDLPQTIVGRCYTDISKPTSDLSNCYGRGSLFSLFAGSSHGTAVAEIVMDMAPDASLYIANPGTWADLHSTVQWMKQQGVQVIVYSVVWAFHGGADGVSPHPISPLNTVKWAADNGILWVNGAGNYGQRAWYGPFNDSDNDKKHEFLSGNECQSFSMRKDDSVAINLRWDDTWGGASKDLAIHFVKDPCTAAETLVASESDPQSGGASHFPAEYRRFTAPQTGRFGIQIVLKSGSAPSWIQVIRFGYGTLPIATARGSIASPGDSPHQGVLAVAGAKSHIKYTPEPYSSQGPTPDNRQKPDITGATNVATNRGGVFAGTSAAAPHIGGLAALILQQSPEFTPTQSATYLESHAYAGSKSKPNYQTGYGFAQLPNHSCLGGLVGGRATTGRWTTYCRSAIDANRNSWYYVFSLSAQTAVTIDLASNIDGLLNLRQGYNNQAGTVLHSDDNSGTGTNARISQTLAAGTYTLEATTAADAQSGDFTLTATGPPELPLITVRGPSEVAEGDTATYTVSAEPKPTAPLVVSVGVVPHGDFGVSTARHTVTIPVTGSQTFEIDTSNDEIDEQHGWMEVSIIYGRTYVFSPTDKYVQTRVMDDDSNQCSTVLTADGTTQGHWSDTCPSTDRTNRNASYYSFEVKQRSSVDIRLRSIRDNVLYLREGKDSKSGIYIYNNDDEHGATRNARINQSLSPGWYTIEATTYSQGVTGPFSLQISGLGSGSSVPEISIAQGADVVEGANATYTISASPAPTSDLSVPITVADSGDFADSGQAGARTVTITSGTSSATLTVTTDNDAVDETDGTITATLDTPAANAGYTVSSSAGSAVVAVSDNDGVAEPPLVKYAALVSRIKTQYIPSPSYTGEDHDFKRVLKTLKDPTYESYNGSLVSEQEAINRRTLPSDNPRWEGVSDAIAYTNAYVPPTNNGPTVSIVSDGDITEGAFAAFSITATAATSVTVNMEVTVTGAFGVTNGPASVTLTVGGTGAVSFTTFNDSVDEADGTVTVAIQQHADYTIGTNGTATLTIADNDVPVVSIVSDGAVSEGTAASYTVSANPTPYQALTVPITVTDSGDFAESGQTGARSVTVPTTGSVQLTVTTDDDSVDESDGTMTASLNASAADAGYTVSNTAGSAVVIVSDNDVPEVSIVKGADISEGVNATFTVSASPTPRDPLTVAITVTDSGDFADSGQDGARSVVIPTSGSVTLTVTTDDDSTDEADGTITAALDTPAADAGYTVKAIASSAVVNVADDDGTTTAQHPTEKYAALVQSFYDRITANSQHGNSAAGGWNKRFLKAMGHAEYVNYPQAAATVQDAQDRWQNGANTSWDGTVDAITYAEQYFAGTTTTVNPEITITAGSGVTEGAAATFTVNADSAPTTNLDVSVTATDSGAFASASQAGSRTVTIQSGATSATLSVVTANDAVDEADGTISAEVQSSSGYTVGSASSASVAVADNDVPVVSITSDGNVTEGTAASFTVAASPTPYQALTVAITVADSGNFADTGQAGARSVTVPTTGSVKLTITTDNDSVDETDGTITATLDAPGASAGYTLSTTNGSATATVSDNDVTTAVSPLVKYASLIARIKTDVQSPNYSNEPHDLSRVLKTLGDPAYLSYNGNVVGVQEAINRRTRPSRNTHWDGIPEAIQYKLDYDAGTLITPPPSTDPVVQIAGGAAVTEGSAATFTISADQTPANPITVKVTVTAVGDYGISTGVKNISVSSTSTNFTVATTDDDFDEPNGSAVATIVAGSGYTLGATKVANVTIEDDEATPTVRLTRKTDATEGTPVTFTLTANPKPSQAIQVNIAFTVTGDYGATNKTAVVNIHPSGSLEYSQGTLDDNLDEPDGSITLTVLSGTGYTVGSPSSMTAVVRDDDGTTPTPTPEITITGGSGITEGGTASFTISASPAPTSPITVNMGFSQSGSWGASGASTVSVSGATATYTISTSDDNTDEPNGLVTATVKAGSGYTVGTPAAANVLVSDDDATIIVPQSVVLTISGGGDIAEGGSTTFTINADSAPSSAITVNVGLTQTGGYAATGPGTTVTLSGTSASYTVNVPENSLDQADGSVTVTLTSGTGYTVGSPGSKTVHVTDNDVPEVSIAAGAGVTEGGSATFTLTVNPKPHNSISVKVGIAANGDFGASTVTQTISIGASGTATVTVATTGDSVDEADGSVTATVQSGTGYTVDSSAGSATVAVSDDDVPQVTVTASTDATEGNDVTFTLTADPTPHTALSVKVGFTATDGFGVATADRTVSIPTSGSVVVRIATTNDDEDEADGTVTLTVKSGTGYTVGTAASRSATVSDDDAPTTGNADTLTVSVSTSSDRNRPGDTIRFTLTLNETAQQDVTVAWSVNYAGMLEGMDLTVLSSNPVTIQKGEDKGYIDIYLKPNAWFGTSKHPYWSLSLGALTGAKSHNGGATAYISE